MRENWELAMARSSWWLDFFLMLRLHLILSTMYTFYENVTAALLFSSFSPFVVTMRSICLHFPILFSVFQLLRSTTRIHNKKNPSTMHKTKEVRREVQKELKKKWFYVLFICYLCAVAYLKVACVYMWCSCNVNVFVVATIFSMPLFTFGYVQRMLCPCAYYLNLFFFLCWRIFILLLLLLLYELIWIT